MPQSLALIAANFPKDIRGRAIGTWAAASAMTTALGPPIGGLLIDTLSWRVAFWINLPIAAVALWLTLCHVPESRDEAARGPVDWAGAPLATAGFGAITYGLIAIGETGAASLPSIGAIAAGVVLVASSSCRTPRRQPDDAAGAVPLAGLHRRQHRHRPPLRRARGALFLLPFDLLARRGLTTARGRPDHPARSA